MLSRIYDYSHDARHLLKSNAPSSSTPLASLTDASVCTSTVSYALTRRPIHAQFSDAKVPSYARRYPLGSWDCKARWTVRRHYYVDSDTLPSRHTWRDRRRVSLLEAMEKTKCRKPARELEEARCCCQASGPCSSLGINGSEQTEQHRAWEGAKGESRS